MRVRTFIDFAVSYMSTRLKPDNEDSVASVDGMLEPAEVPSYWHADARACTLELNFFAEPSDIVEAAASLRVGQNRRRAPTIRIAHCGERIRDRLALTG